MVGRITVINYGMGNLGSIANMCKRIGVKAEVTSDPDAVKRAEKLLLPGVGAFDAAVEHIEAISGLREALDEKVLVHKTPVLGICLGMQLLLEKSEEGQRLGLGYVPGEVVRFPRRDGLKVPHMGWNEVKILRDSPIVKDLPHPPRFYFVHSYYVQCAHPQHVVGITHYGVDFHSLIQRGHIFGAQFHPEKSHKYGMKLLENFASL